MLEKQGFMCIPYDYLSRRLAHEKHWAAQNAQTPLYNGIYKEFPQSSKKKKTP